jgi:hypothetical protein
VGSARLQTDEAYIGYVLSVLLCGEDVLAVGVALKRGVDLKKPFRSCATTRRRRLHSTRPQGRPGEFTSSV